MSPARFPQFDHGVLFDLQPTRCQHGDPKAVGKSREGVVSASYPKVDSESQLLDLLVKVLKRYPGGINVSAVKSVIHKQFGLELDEGAFKKLGYRKLFDVLNCPVISSVCSLSSHRSGDRFKCKIVLRAGVDLDICQFDTSCNIRPISNSPTDGSLFAATVPSGSKSRAASGAHLVQKTSSLRSTIDAFPLPVSGDMISPFDEEALLAYVIASMTAWHAQRARDNVDGPSQA
jgi:hypothetical protein